MDDNSSSLERSLSFYRKILPPTHPLAKGLHHLAVFLKRKGELVIARQLFYQALSIQPQFLEAHNNLGSLLILQSEWNEAVDVFNQSLAILPGQAEIHYKLGIIFCHKRDLTSAIASFEETLRLSPDSPQAHHNLGTVLLDAKKPIRAETHFRKALQLKPEYVEAHNNLGNALLEQNQLEAAHHHFHRALAINPRYAQSYNNLGNAWMLSNRPIKAIECYQQALALLPSHADIYNNLGNALDLVGRFSEAHESYKKALQLCPQKIEFYYNLSRFKRFNREDASLVAMEKMAATSASMSVPDQIYLHFALGKACADIGDQATSFQHLLKGNTLKRRQVVYNEANTLEFYQRIKRIFCAPLIQAKANLGNPSPCPVFVIGMPRSGTTLVEQILASHSKVSCAGELKDLEETIKKIPEIVQGISQSQRDQFPLLSLFPEVMANLNQEHLHRLGTMYLHQLKTAVSASLADRIIDKMPGNFRFAGLIALILPQARIIHVRRDPIDTCLSSFSKLFKDGCLYSYNLGELGRHHQAYEKLMKHWKEVLSPELMLEVQYEEIVQDLETQAKRIIAHVNLEWEESCLKFYQTERPIHTASAAEVRQPIYKTSVNRWRPDAEILRPLVEGLQGS